MANALNTVTEQQLREQYAASKLFLVGLTFDAAMRQPGHRREP